MVMFSRHTQRAEKRYLNHHKCIFPAEFCGPTQDILKFPLPMSPHWRQGVPELYWRRWKYMVDSSDGRVHILGRTDAADPTQDPVISEQYSPCSETKHRSVRSLWSEEKCNRFDATTIFVNDKTA